MTSLKLIAKFFDQDYFYLPMSASPQSYFPGFDGLKVKAFGGSLVKGNPREARPISIKRPMHLVMRATLAKGEKSFLHSKRARKIEALVKTTGSKTGVRVYRYANSGNHLHLVLIPRSRNAFKAYVRAISGLIAREVLGTQRGKGMKNPARSSSQSNEAKKFWDLRPFTRILTWGREFKKVTEYLEQNRLEALGFIPYKPRVHKTKLSRGRPA